MLALNLKKHKQNNELSNQMLDKRMLFEKISTDSNQYAALATSYKKPKDTTNTGTKYAGFFAFIAMGGLSVVFACAIAVKALNRKKKSQVADLEETLL